MINILPYEQKKMVKNIRYIRMANVFVLGLALLIVVAGVLLVPIFITINSRYSIAQSEINHLEESGIIIKDVDLASLEARTRTLLLKLSTTLPMSPVQYIALVRDLTPSSIYIQDFAMTNTIIPTLYLSGIARSRADLQNFVDTIKADPTVVSVNSPVSNFVKSVGGDFKISITFKK